MKTLFGLLMTAILLTVSVDGVAQNGKAKKVKLSQTTGAFKQTELKLKAGKTYVFEVSNDGVDHEVGFVVTPKGKTEQENHIAEAYLEKVVGDGQTASSKEVTLEKGEYVYFCPLNPTPQYSLIVE
ncbi:MAG: cupredoxin domain-containing protein [Cyclobacteriaceae bacterium]|nr:cupredoxin domain-containing protein [Cyclobacteriaceae bacterium HetDA_MAG_MS6]